MVTMVQLTMCSAVPRVQRHSWEVLHGARAWTPRSVGIEWPRFGAQGGTA